jgi:hypothetical protein
MKIKKTIHKKYIGTVPCKIYTVAVIIKGSYSGYLFPKPDPKPKVIYKHHNSLKFWTQAT